MSSWYSNILTKTSSQISSLRSTLLSGEADGDTEDDTHVCRVLRGYYTEKGRPLPSWLPPDPKAPAPTPQPLLVNNAVGQRYGGLGNPPQPAGGLSSLWDSNGPASAPAAPQSLRAGGGRTPAALQSGGSEGIQRRPVGGQRAGSYNNAPAAAAANPYGRSEAANRSPTQTGGGGGGGGGGRSAQDLLRQRLWGSRTTSPSQQGGSQGPFAPPSGPSNGGGGGNYEDRFAPGGMYDSSSNGSGSDKPYMSANAPWSSGGDDYSGRPSRRQGLPTGPRAYR